MNLRRLRLDTELVDQISNKLFDPLYIRLYRPLHLHLLFEVQDKLWRHFQNCLNQDEYVRQKAAHDQLNV